jgi:cytochrome c
VTVGAGSGGIGGDVEFRAGSPTGALLGTVRIPNTGGWGHLVSPTVELADPGRPVKLYVVFSNPEWSADKPDLLALDWLHFNGPGVEKCPAGSVRVTAAPAVGAPPLAVSLKGTAHLPSGRAVKTYHWDFGDGSPAAHGETAQHTYTRKGTYTARLTVTDDKGNTTPGSTVISVG